MPFNRKTGLFIEISDDILLLNLIVFNLQIILYYILLFKSYPLPKTYCLRQYWLVFNCPLVSV